MRFLGYVWRSPKLSLGSLRTLVLIEMVTRAIKVVPTTMHNQKIFRTSEYCSQSVLRSVMRSAESERDMAE